MYKMTLPESLSCHAIWAFDTFRELVRDEEPELFTHPFADRELTEVRIVGPTNAEVNFLSEDIRLPGLSFREGPEHLAELVFDHGRNAKRIDLRPRLPVVLVH